MTKRWLVIGMGVAVMAMALVTMPRVLRDPPPAEHLSEGKAVVSGQAERGEYKAKRMNRTEQLKAILASNDPLARPMEFGRAFGEWLEDDLAGALKFLRGMPRGNEFTEGLTMAIERLANGNPEGAMALANEMVRSSGEMHVYNLLVAKIAETEPAGALQVLEQAPLGTARENALQALGSTWAKRDVESALKWARSLSTPMEKELAVKSVLLAQADREPADAFRNGLEQLSGEALTSVIDAAVNRTMALAGDAGDGLNEQSQKMLWSVIAEAAPERISAGSAGQLAMVIAEQSPEEALEWAGKLTNPEAQKVAQTAALETWAATEPDSAGGYILGMPASEQQTIAARQFVRRLAEADQQRAFDWAQSIASPQLRSTMLVELASCMAQRAPDAAIAWVNSWPAETPERSKALAAARSYLALPEPDFDLGSSSPSPAR